MPLPLPSLHCSPCSFQAAQRRAATGATEPLDASVTPDGAFTHYVTLGAVDFFGEHCSPPADLHRVGGGGGGAARDENCDDAAAPLSRATQLHLEDVRVGMALAGTVCNVGEFGASVDVGLKVDGLLRQSEIARSFSGGSQVTALAAGAGTAAPLHLPPRSCMLAVGDVVRVRVLSFDVAQKQLALTLDTAAPDTQAVPAPDTPDTWTNVQAAQAKAEFGTHARTAAALRKARALASVARRAGAERTRRLAALAQAAQQRKQLSVQRRQQQLSAVPQHPQRHQLAAHYPRSAEQLATVVAAKRATSAAGAVGATGAAPLPPPDDPEAAHAADREQLDKAGGWGSPYVSSQ